MSTIVFMYWVTVVGGVLVSLSSRSFIPKLAAIAAVLVNGALMFVAAFFDAFLAPYADLSGLFAYGELITLFALGAVFFHYDMETSYR